MKGKKVTRVAVIGAGPAGLATAYKLARAGIKVDVYEAQDQVGGMSRTINLWGQRVDLGPHRFFSNNAKVNRLWLEVVGSNYEMVNRLTRIYYRHKFFDYPIKAGDALRKLGLVESVRCVGSYLKANINFTSNQKPLVTFEDWVVSRFGRRLFNHFFKSYSEKLWGISCQELDADFASQRIKKFSLLEAIKDNLPSRNKVQHQTLLSQFAYPDGGTGSVYEQMSRAITDLGNNVYLQTPITRVVVNGLRATGVEVNGKIKKYDHVVSSMPLDILVRLLPDVPKPLMHNLSKLKFRNTMLVYLLVEDDALFPDQWLYIHDQRLKTGRITNFRNWTASINRQQKGTILCLEYWCYDEDQIWQEPDEKLIYRGIQELTQTGLIKNHAISKGKVVRIPKCYPVYGRGYRHNLKPVEDYLSRFQQLEIIGRAGAFKYNNQDHSMLMGILAAENISSNTRHNLWAINTDSEYQESATFATVEAEMYQLQLADWAQTINQLRQLLPAAGNYSALNTVRKSELAAILDRLGWSAHEGQKTDLLLVFSDHQGPKKPISLPAKLLSSLSTGGIVLSDHPQKEKELRLVHKETEPRDLYYYTLDH